MWMIPYLPMKHGKYGRKKQTKLIFYAKKRRKTSPSMMNFSCRMYFSSVPSKGSDVLALLLEELLDLLCRIDEVGK